MENASKALIIAGAILISILLIGVGMMIYNAAIKPVSEGQSQMDETAKQMFNGKFDRYDGTQKGSNVKSLISAVITSNAQNEDGIVVSVNGHTTSADLSTLRSSVTDGKTYTVSMTYDDDGLINSVTVTGLTVKGDK